MAVNLLRGNFSMTFDEAMQKLNHWDIASVANEMIDWHPALLGQMLLAVAVAKKVRYPGPHPDYTKPAVAVIKTAGEKAAVGQLVKQNTQMETAQINLAVGRFEDAEDT